MYKLNRGVTIFLSPEIEKMLEVLHKVYRAYKLPLVITSGVEGPHREGSLHYQFRAIDIRKQFADPADVTTWSIHGKSIIQALQINFNLREYPVNVLNEIDHLHVEWA